MDSSAQYGVDGKWPKTHVWDTWSQVTQTLEMGPRGQTFASGVGFPSLLLGLVTKWETAFIDAQDRAVPNTPFEPRWTDIPTPPTKKKTTTSLNVIFVGYFAPVTSKTIQTSSGIPMVYDLCETDSDRKMKGLLGAVVRKLPEFLPCSGGILGSVSQNSCGRAGACSPDSFREV